MDDFHEKFDAALEAIDERFVPKHIVDDWFLCEGMNLICNRSFLEEVDKEILEEVKDKSK